MITDRPRTARRRPAAAKPPEKRKKGLNGMNAINVYKMTEKIKNGDVGALDALRRECLAEMATAKRKHKAADKARAKMCEKLAGRNDLPANLRGSWITADGRQAACDGRFAVVWDDQMEGCAEVDEGLDKIDFVRYFAAANDGEQVRKNVARADVLNACTAVMRQARAVGEKWPLVFVCGGYFDPRMMRDVVETLADSEGEPLILCRNAQKMAAGLIIRAMNGDALVMPVNVGKKLPSLVAEI